MFGSTALATHTLSILAPFCLWKIPKYVKEETTKRETKQEETKTLAPNHTVVRAPKWSQTAADSKWEEEEGSQAQIHRRESKGGRS